jgi:hypothetical protein
MDVLKFVAEIVSSIAWPIAATAIALIFRNEIKTLLGRIKKGKLGSAEFEFEKDTLALKEVIFEGMKDDSIVVTSPSSELPWSGREPATAVISTWSSIEDLARQVALKKGLIDPFNAINPSRVIRALEKEHTLEPTFVTLFHELRALRNQAAHGTDFRPSAESLKGYLDMAEILQQKLRNELTDK